MSSSSEAGFVRALSREASAEQVAGTWSVAQPEASAPPAAPDLRVARWTRLGGDSVRGDQITEDLLDGLATRTQQAARSQGYSIGWAEGRRAAAEQAAHEEAERVSRNAAAEQRREDEHRDAVAALGRAAEQVRGLLGELGAAVEGQATELACALTAEVLGAHVAAATPADVLARVLQVLPAVPVGRVRLHPSVTGSAGVPDLLDRGLEVVADPTLGRADALVEDPDGSVTDLRINEAMARVREVLS